MKAFVFPVIALTFGLYGLCGADLVLVLAQALSYLRGRWVGDDGTDYFAGCRRITIPVLALAGGGDWLIAPLPAATVEMLRHATFGFWSTQLTNWPVSAKPAPTWMTRLATRLRSRSIAANPSLSCRRGTKSSRSCPANAW